MPVGGGSAVVVLAERSVVIGASVDGRPATIAPVEDVQEQSWWFQSRNG